MSKKLLLAAILIALIGTAVVMWRSGRSTASITIDSPKAGETMTSPFTVIGQARGEWFFEASFPVRLFDALDREIAVAPAQAEGDWMTEDFVPFTATLSFDVPTAQYGTLVLMKDNPSGLPENDERVEIAVWLEPSAGGAPAAETVVEAFFGKSGAAAGEECTTVAAVQRSVPKTQAVARAALEELLKGPSAEDAAQGFITSIPSGVALQSLDITNGTARADFSAALETGVGGSCRVTHIRRQIEETLKQFPTVQNVIISIDGRTEDILQP